MFEQGTALWYYTFFSSADKGGSSGYSGAEDTNDGKVWDEYEMSEEEERLIELQLSNFTERCRMDAKTYKNLGTDVVAWDQFYETHNVNFFKDRHYLAAAFPEEFGEHVQNPCLVELGCGVGNALLPLLENCGERPWTVYGMDLSGVAISLLRRDQRFVAASEEGRAFCEAGDLCHGVPDNFRSKATVSSLLFCLSAIHPSQQREAVVHAASTIQPNGVLVFRDYGRLDEAQVKLGSQRNKLITDNFYRKADGTKCYYFTLDDARSIFTDAGLEVLELNYIKKVFRNRAENSTRRRVWISGRFKKRG